MTNLLISKKICSSILYVGIASISFSLVACKQENITTGPKPIAFPQPKNFPEPVYNLASNPLTQEGFELGRKLFYEVKFSRDNSISCGSCHLQANAFTHHGHDVSHGIDDRVGTRNSPSIQNLAWSKSFFWDGGVFNLDLQPLAPIENPVEMDEKLPVVLEKLRKDPAYPPLFNRAFGSTEINTNRVLKAMSQFMLMCVSANSKYDAYVRNGGSLTVEEMKGLSTFQQKCSGCHSTDLFTDEKFHNNGLTPSLVDDKGRFFITLQEKDNYSFKTPSLRNVALTGPYMHDGRFRTLDAALEHYNSGVMFSPTLDQALQTNPGQPGIRLNAEEKKNIIAFLNTLTDNNFIRDPKLSEQ
jgi:cytochrome c peroxidase